jgi:hypothetical protein
MRSTKNRPAIDRSIAIGALDMPAVEELVPLDELIIRLDWFQINCWRGEEEIVSSLQRIEPRPCNRRQ